VTLVVLLLAPAADAATVTLSPAAGPAGSKVTLHGGGFPARAKVRVAAAGRRVAAAKANARGAFRVKLTIPRAGTTIRLRSRARGRRVRNIFRVTTGPVALSRELANGRGERLRWTPANPAAGSSVAVSARGFPASVPLRIVLAPSAQAALTVRTNRRGRADASVPIPAAARGPHVIRVRVGRRTMRLPVTVRANTGPGGSQPNPLAPGPGEPLAQPPSGDPVIAAAGDISCASVCSSSKATSDLLVGLGLNGVLTLGDNQYEDGLLGDYNSYFDPTWGRVDSIIHPSPGNHEYNSGAAGYFAYFGAHGVNVGTSSQPYYSFDIGTWHLISLNSEVAPDAGSAQETWLKTDLATHNNACTLAYWHKPFFSSSSEHGAQQDMLPLVQDLYDANADVLLAGHNHIYERFAPQNPSRVADSRGLRAFVVGTGGRSHYPVGTTAANSEVQNADTYGVLKMTLHPNGYDFQFVPIAGQTFTDAGSGSCH
jgi:Calcineurin-like phosphoesterase